MIPGASGSEYSDPPDGEFDLKTCVAALSDSGEEDASPGCSRTFQERLPDGAELISLACLWLDSLFSFSSDILP